MRCTKVTYLSFFYRGRIPVAHWTNVHAAVSFQVSLAKELGHDPIGPLTVEIERLRWITEISTVYHVLQHLYIKYGTRLTL